MIFQFRALSDENDKFLRDYRLMYNASLLDFHNFMCADLDFDPTAMASFFMSDRQWEKLREFTLADMGADETEEAPRPMESVTLQEVIGDNGDRLIYTFDFFGDRSLYLEMIGTYQAEEGREYPCTVLAEGPAPYQFDAALTAGEDSIFDDAMSEFGGFEGDDSYDEDL